MEVTGTVVINADHMRAGSRQSVAEIFNFLDALTEAGLLKGKCTWDGHDSEITLTVPADCLKHFVRAGYAVYAPGEKL